MLQKSHKELRTEISRRGRSERVEEGGRGKVEKARQRRESGGKGEGAGRGSRKGRV